MITREDAMTVTRARGRFFEDFAIGDESRSRPNVGIDTVRTTGFNQDGTR